MNWAAWEYMVACNKRKDRWRVAVGARVIGSRRMIYDTRPNAMFVKSRPEFDFDKMADRFSKVYGGAVSGRMSSGKNLTANMILAQQQSARTLLTAAQQNITRMLSHQMDTLFYATMLHSLVEKKRGPWRMIHDEIWLDDFEWDVGLKKPKGKIKFEFYERASRWQSNLTDLDRSSSVTLLPEPDTSRSDGNKSKRGWLSKTRRRSMAWLPMPRTKLIQCQKPVANSLA